MDTRSRISDPDSETATTVGGGMYRRDSTQYGSIQDIQEKLPPAGMPSRYEHRPQGRSRYAISYSRFVRNIHLQLSHISILKDGNIVMVSRNIVNVIN